MLADRVLTAVMREPGKLRIEKAEWEENITYSAGIHIYFVDVFPESR